MKEKDIKAEAKRLDQAERDREQIEATTVRHPDLSIENAYAIQSAWMGIKKEAGRTVAGYKIGLTSRTMQRSMHIDEPDYGTLLDDMVFEEGATIEADRFLDPRIEVELAFMLGTPLVGDTITLFDVLRATEFIVPALEIIAARTYRVHPETGYKRTVRDTISDNAANGGVILGGRPVKPDAVDPRWIGALLFCNGVIEETGVSAAVLNHPAKGVAWLANTFAAHGVVLEPGKIILAGSFTRPVKVAAGDNIHVDFGHLGSISCQFS